MRPFKAVRFSRNSKSGLIRNIINAGIRPAYEKVRSIFPYDKGDRGRSAEPTCERSLLFSLLCYKKLFILFCKDPDDFTLPSPMAPRRSISLPFFASIVFRTF